MSAHAVPPSITRTAGPVVSIHYIGGHPAITTMEGPAGDIGGSTPALPEQLICTGILSNDTNRVLIYFDWQASRQTTLCDCYTSILWPHTSVDIEVRVSISPRSDAGMMGSKVGRVGGGGGARD